MRTNRDRHNIEQTADPFGRLAHAVVLQAVRDYAAGDDSAGDWLSNGNLFTEFIGIDFTPGMLAQARDGGKRFRNSTIERKLANYEKIFLEV